MKAVFFEIENWENELLAGLCRGIEYDIVRAALNTENADHFSGAEIISCFIYSRLDKAVLEKFTNLKPIATRSTGYDHIDLAYCRDRCIAVANVPAYGAHT